MTSWNCQPHPGEITLQVGQMPAWQMAWAAARTAHIRSIKCVLPEGSQPSQECQGGHPGAWLGLQHEFPALPTPLTPACSVLLEGGRTRALSFHLKANLRVSWFSADVQPRLYMTAPLGSGPMFPPNEPATAELKRIIKQQNLHEDFAQKPCDIYRVLKKLLNFQILWFHVL